MIDWRTGKSLCSSAARDACFRGTFSWVFGHCVGETICFAGGTLLGVIISRPNVVLYYVAF